MVVYDNLFKKDFGGMPDQKLLEFRREQVENLFNGDAGSRSHVEREALINICDREIDVRFKRKAEIRSNTAIVISIIALAFSTIPILNKIYGIIFNS